MEKSLAVANGIIQLGLQHSLPPTQMKLQKLMYFAHGWHLALYDAPLVDEQFQAWAYGPVIPSVYHEFKSFGMLGIDQPATILCPLSSGGFEWVAPTVQNADIVPPLLNKIWEVFGSYSGGQLSEMTHIDGSPWKMVFEQCRGARNTPIPDETIKSYFKGLMSHGNA